MKIIFLECKYHHHFSLPWATSPTGLNSADQLWALSFQELAMLPSIQFPEMTSHLPPGALKHSSAWKFLLQPAHTEAPFNSQLQCWTDRLSLIAPFQVYISCLFCITALCSPPSQHFPDFVRCSCILVYQKITIPHPNKIQGLLEEESRGFLSP